MTPPIIASVYHRRYLPTARDNNKTCDSSLIDDPALIIIIVLDLAYHRRFGWFFSIGDNRPWFSSIYTHQCRMMAHGWYLSTVISNKSPIHTNITLTWEKIITSFLLCFTEYLTTWKKSITRNFIFIIFSIPIFEYYSNFPLLTLKFLQHWKIFKGLRRFPVGPTLVSTF
jgi:hypothetical protein